jgi:branched-chain amino acid transport system ATP-binding protein
MDNLLIGNVQKRMMWWQVVFGRRDELYLAMQARFTSQYGRDIEDRFPLQLAHGDQRRLEVLSCLSSEPVLLLLDEPGAGLNSDEKSELADLLRAARRSYPISYLVVDHDLSFIEMICDRSVVMNSGTMVVESDIAPPASAGAVSAAGGHEVDAC